MTAPAVVAAHPTRSLDAARADVSIATGGNRDMINLQGSCGCREEREQRALEVLTFEAIALIVFVALIGALVVALMTGLLDGLLGETTFIIPA